ncbi:outer membrane beta-barrel protein [Neolewinella antarctica]|uniref:Outer membrane protein beta-barrel domain-containing protein n=1 Tax=Neolewinella antarctica TaxID=442734 RepID=A0ABX0XAI7_9BACT|nr:outer membrane beta-barrel protein [Neolewinella antarctica]NJC25963.1 hypothetical protein [Neolewinella antarctica]
MRSILLICGLLITQLGFSQSEITDTTVSRPSVSGLYLSLDSELNTNVYESFVDGGLQTARLGYGITNRVMVGARISSRFNYFSGDANFEANESFLFARYYFLLRQRTRMFAEVGIGTDKVFGERLTTYNLAVGLERQLAPGIVATGLLLYNRIESVQYVFDLTFGFATYLNQLSTLDREAGFERGTFILNQNWGTISSTQQIVDPQTISQQFLVINFNPRVGYFVSDHLLAEVGISANFSQDKNDSRVPISVHYTGKSIGGSAGLRYLPFPRARFAPYIGGEFGFEATEETDGDIFGRGSSTKSTFSTNYVAASLGVMHRLSKHLSIDLNGQYVSAQASRVSPRYEVVRLSLGLRALLVRGRK